jgi:hypothetical protein
MISEKYNPPRFAIIKGLRYDVDKATKLAAGGYVHIEENKETVKPVLFKTNNGNYFLCWESADGDVSCIEALSKKKAFKWCCDLDLLVAEKEFGDMIQEG